MLKSPAHRSHLPRRLGILAASLALSALLPSAASASRAPELHTLSLLPASADLVVWVDYFALRKSDLVAEMESRFDSIPEASGHYRQFVRETGLDPRLDTDQVLISLRTVAGSGGGFLLVARGRFDGTRILETAAEKGGRVITTGEGIRIWTSRQEPGGSGEPSQGRGVVALAQPNGSTLLFGEESEVVRAAEVATGTKRPEKKEPRFRDLLAGVDRKAPVWALLNSESLAKQVSLEMSRSNADWKPGEALAAVNSVRMSCWAGRDLDMKIQVEAKDEESALLLADLFRGALAAGKLAAKDRDPELLGTLQEMTITQDGTGIEARVRIPGSRLRPPEAADSSR